MKRDITPLHQNNLAFHSTGINIHKDLQIRRSTDHKFSPGENLLANI